MKCLLAGFIMPHPPVIVSEVGKENAKIAIDTIEACRKISMKVKELKPETIVVISPHGNIFRDYVYLLSDRILKGDFKQFGQIDLKYSFENDVLLVNEICNLSKIAKFQAGILEENTKKALNIDQSLDHGALVPLDFIKKEYSKFKVVHISVAGMEYDKLVMFGRILNEAIERTKRKTVIVASGDLSHYVNANSPYGVRKEGKEFDLELSKMIENNSFNKLTQIDKKIVEKSGQCGYASFLIMKGALEKSSYISSLLSYEAPFGIGYLVSMMIVKQSIYVEVAKRAIRSYIEDGLYYSGDENLDFASFNKRAACFVSLHKNGNLRGCIGTILPTKQNLFEEIVHNAVSSAMRDPRFDAVTLKELDDLEVNVDVLSKLAKVNNINMLNPKKYGVVVSNGNKRGLLLPDLEGVNTSRQQLDIALRKANIYSDDYEIERFTVKRYT